MKMAKVIALAGLLAMTGILIYAFTSGDFSAEGTKLPSMPWGIVSLIDLYVGFILFSGWIVFREKTILPFHDLGSPDDGVRLLGRRAVYSRRLTNQQRRLEMLLVWQALQQRIRKRAFKIASPA